MSALVATEPYAAFRRFVTLSGVLAADAKS